MGFPVHQGEHIRPEVGLDGGLLVKVVEDDAGIGIALEFDDDAHPVAIAFISDIGNPFQAFLVHHVGDFFDQPGFIHLIGQLGDDNCLAIGCAAPFDGFDFGHPAHGNRTPTGSIGIANPTFTEDLPPGGKVGAGNVPSQFRRIDVGVVN